MAQTVLRWLAHNWFEISVLTGILVVIIRLMTLEYTIKCSANYIAAEIRDNTQRTAIGEILNGIHQTGQEADKCRTDICWKLDELRYDTKSAAADLDQSVKGVRDEIKGGIYDLKNQIEGLALDLALGRN